MDVVVDEVVVVALVVDAVGSDSVMHRQQLLVRHKLWLRRMTMSFQHRQLQQRPYLPMDDDGHGYYCYYYFDDSMMMINCLMVTT